MNKTVILIAGPTAAGKTALAINIAQSFGTSIISADSRQCFRELNIGVAKPSVEELQAVPHYFINTHAVHEQVTAASFETYALEVAEKLFQTKDVIVMAGGTGLYIKAFLEGMDEIPAVDEAVRNQLTALYEANGMDWLQWQLQQQDPLFAAEGEMQNPQRMLRALEVMETTGKSIIHYQKGAKKKRDFEVIKIGLDLLRQELYDRINYRVDVMIQHGLLEEVRSLLPLQHLNALQTVGYRELFDHFNGQSSLDQAINKIKQNTRHYAKRQLTWFKRDEAMRWFHPIANDEIMRYIQSQIKKPR
ncbi:MAG: tRNA (adenosine(37)-N6)-dimethylallyltransferase MiaA [Chitinophagaceae bacterium]|nr:tRNA (adenosine(37)-N6)-dimethylallyltransferase MiaA [Chitinophagaceae bacterium]